MKPVISHFQALFATDPWCEGKKKKARDRPKTVSLLGTIRITKMKQVGVEETVIIFLVGLISTI